MKIKVDDNLKRFVDSLKIAGFDIKEAQGEDNYFYLPNEREKIKIIEIDEEKKEINLHLLKYNKDGQLEYQNGFKYVVFDYQFNINSIIYFNNNYKTYILSQGYNFRRINNLDTSVDKLILKDRYKQKRINTSEKYITLSPTQYNQIIASLWRAEDKAIKYKTSIKNYLLNDLTE